MAASRRFREPDLHILLVEDDSMLADAVYDGARQNGWSIDHAPDAATARLRLLDGTYSVLLLDLGLPHESGLSLLKTMRARYDVTPVMILRARGQLSERIAGSTRAPKITWSSRSSSMNCGPTAGTAAGASREASAHDGLTLPGRRRQPF